MEREETAAVRCPKSLWVLPVHLVSIRLAFNLSLLYASCWGAYDVRALPSRNVSR